MPNGLIEVVVVVAFALQTAAGVLVMLFLQWFGYLPKFKWMKNLQNKVNRGE